MTTTDADEAYWNRVRKCRCQHWQIAAAPGRVCRCGITWHQRQADWIGPGSFYAEGPTGERVVASVHEGDL